MRNDYLTWCFLRSLRTCWPMLAGRYPKLPRALPENRVLVGSIICQSAFDVSSPLVGCCSDLCGMANRGIHKTAFLSKSVLKNPAQTCFLRCAVGLSVISVSMAVDPDFLFRLRTSNGTFRKGKLIGLQK